MQSKDTLEEFYLNPDPWNYKADKWDEVRKDIIIATAKRYTPLGARVLDIGCGEGFITQDLPGMEIHGIELSDNAANRLNERVVRTDRPSGFKKYHVVLACGVLYEQYDWEQMHRWIDRAVMQGSHVITCNIMDWEINKLPRDKQIEVRVFPYREYNQVLRVYKYA